MPTATKSRTTDRGYGRGHQLLRRDWAVVVAAGRQPCARCGELIRPTDPWDLGHADGDRTRDAGPVHRWCNRATNGRSGRALFAAAVEVKPERAGFDARDEVWRVPWLRGLRRVPADATWPRLMTVPHPSAVGSLGREFVAWSKAREGRD